MDAMQHTPLQTLDHTLDDMIGTVTSADSDVKALQDLLTDLKTTLGYPARMESDLKKIHDPLTTVQKLASDISVLPEIGPPAGAMAKAIHPLVLPRPPGGLIGEARAFLKEIDTALSDLKTGLDQIKKPVDDVQDLFDALLTRLTQFKAGVEHLIRTHGAGKSVNQCAQTLNTIIATAQKDLNTAMGAVSGLLSAFFDIGSTIDGVLRGIGGFIGAIDGIVTEVTASKAFREMTKALHKVEAELNKLRHVAEAFMKSVLKAMGLDVDGFENGMKRFEDRIEHFIMKSVNDALNRATSTLTAELEKMPAVQSFESALGTLRDEMIALRNKVENGLGADCTKVLTTLA